MMPVVSLALLSLVQTGWQVEETVLAPAPWVVESATPIDDETVGVIATLPGPDAGLEFGVFIARAGETPSLLQRYSASTGEGTGSGTGFTVSVVRESKKQELLRVRLGGATSLVSLGVFDKESRAVSCDDEVTDCVLVMGDGTVHRWRAGQLSPLFEVPQADETNDFAAWGAAMRPDGGVVALGLGASTALLWLDGSKVTVIRGALTLARPSLAALAQELADKQTFRDRWDRAAQDCTTTPEGWKDGRALVSVGPMGDIGAADCPVRPGNFEFDLVSTKRKAIPAYPWQVLDCPAGGWSSSLGTMVTDCTDADVKMSRMMRGPRATDVEERDLPEAVALSETDLFVMEPEPKHPYRWFRGTPKGKGLTFVVDGPSVLHFVPKGVTVEQVSWRFGTAVFQHPLRDDWHLIEPQQGPRAMVRLRPIP